MQSDKPLLTFDLIWSEQTYFHKPEGSSPLMSWTRIRHKNANRLIFCHIFCHTFWHICSALEKSKNYDIVNQLYKLTVIFTTVKVIFTITLNDVIGFSSDFVIIRRPLLASLITDRHSEINGSLDPYWCWTILNWNTSVRETLEIRLKNNIGPRKINFIEYVLLRKWPWIWLRTYLHNEFKATRKILWEKTAWNHDLKFSTVFNDSNGRFLLLRAPSRWPASSDRWRGSWFRTRIFGRAECESVIFGIGNKADSESNEWILGFHSIIL